MASALKCRSRTCLLASLTFATAALAVADADGDSPALPAGRAGPLPVLRDVAAESGLRQTIVSGDTVTESLLDVNGQGACFFDFDGDGFLDIYFANGSSKSRDRAGKPPQDHMFRNRGDGTFEEVTAKLGLGDTNWSSGCVVGDYDGDGDPDLFVTNYGANKLYRNDGGGFADVSREAGFAGPVWSPPKWSMGGSFGDVDNDGDLDLFVTNFSSLDPAAAAPPETEESPCQLKGVPIVCAPDYFDGQQDLLYLNQGDGSFRDASAVAGVLQERPGHGFAAVFSDYDGDGDQDLYVANDAGANFYYANKGDGTFEDISWVSGAVVSEHGEEEGSMGLTVGDYNNDGHLDIFITNFIEQSNRLYQNEGRNLFFDQTTAVGLDAVGFNLSGWGTKFIDLDNDGWLDLFLANGHTDERLEQRIPEDTYAEPDYMLRNVDGERFEDVSHAVGLRALEDRVGRGAAFGDYDNDGDADILVVNKNDRPTLLRNDGGNRRSWLAVRLKGVESNRDGLGAKVYVEAGGMRRFFEVQGSGSYLSGNDLRVHAGLGSEESARVEILWTSGRRDVFESVAARRFYLAVEGQAVRADPRVQPVRKP